MSRVRALRHEAALCPSDPTEIGSRRASGLKKRTQRKPKAPTAAAGRRGSVLHAELRRPESRDPARTSTAYLTANPSCLSWLGGSWKDSFAIFSGPSKGAICPRVVQGIQKRDRN